MADVDAAMSELRRLFLVPNPKMIDDVERFTLEANTRSLVLEWGRRQMPDASTKIRDRWKTLARSSSARGRDPTTISLVRRAEALLADGDLSAAEKTLLSGLGQAPDDQGLNAQLARTYSRWSPPRLTEARSRFGRTIELGSSDPNVFREWLSMEVKAGENSLAVDVGHRGLQRHPADSELRLRVAHAEWLLARTPSDARTRIDRIDAATATLRPLLASSELAILPRVTEEALYISAFALADKITTLDSLEATRTAYTRNPEDIAAQRQESSSRNTSAPDFDRIRLRQILNRINREFPSDRYRDVALRLRPSLMRSGSSRHRAKQKSKTARLDAPPDSSG